MSHGRSDLRILFKNVIKGTHLEKKTSQCKQTSYHSNPLLNIADIEFGPFSVLMAELNRKVGR